MRRAKIVCTLGPATDTDSGVVDLIRHGMSVARLNLSHGSHEDHQRRIHMVRRASEATGVGIAVAVPAVLVYNYFLRRLKLTAADLDDFAHDFYSLAQKNAFRVLLHPTLAKASAGSPQKVKEAS